jgi:hypothetical protein
MCYKPLVSLVFMTAWESSLMRCSADPRIGEQYRGQYTGWQYMATICICMGLCDPIAGHPAYRNHPMLTAVTADGLVWAVEGLC